jgi:hypothetical protein
MTGNRLSDVNRLLSLHEDLEEAALTTAASTLVRQQFVYRYDHGMASTYDLIVRHREYFTGLLRAIGHDFVYDDGAQMVGSLPGAGLPARLQLRLEDTLLLLTLRLILQEEVDRFNVRQNRTVVTDSDTAMAKLEAITGRERPSFGRLREMLQDFERRGLVSLEEAGDRQYRIEIRPALQLVVGADYLARLEQFVASKETDDAPDEARRAGSA